MRPEVVIADDNLRDRQFAAAALDGFKISLAVSGEAALKLARSLRCRCIVSDIQMPEHNGIELARSIWRADPQARIVFWSQHNDEMYVRAISRLVPPDTVYGYVLKDNGAEVLRKAAEQVFCEQQCWIDPRLRPVHARLANPQCGLSDGEYAVLIDIALGLTDALIAERHYLSRRGAQNRLRNLYAKLNVDEDGQEGFNIRARAISTALQRGLLNSYELQREEARLKTWLAQRG